MSVGLGRGVRPDSGQIAAFRRLAPVLGPARTERLLTEAGWKNDHGDGLLYKDGNALSFTLLYRSGNPNEEKMV